MRRFARRSSGVAGFVRPDKVDDDDVRAIDGQHRQRLVAKALIGASDTEEVVGALGSGDYPVAIRLLSRWVVGVATDVY